MQLLLVIPSVGALAAGLASGTSIGDAMRRASAASAITVTRRGATAAIPAAAEVEAFLRTYDRSTISLRVGRSSTNSKGRVTSCRAREPLAARMRPRSLDEIVGRNIS